MTGCQLGLVVERRIRLHRPGVRSVGVFFGFNTSNDLFDALVFQDRLPRDCGQEVSGNGCALPGVQVLEALPCTWLGRRLDPRGGRQRRRLLRARC